MLQYHGDHSPFRMTAEALQHPLPLPPPPLPGKVSTGTHPVETHLPCEDSKVYLLSTTVSLPASLLRCICREQRPEVP